MSRWDPVIPERTLNAFILSSSYPDKIHIQFIHLRAPHTVFCISINPPQKTWLTPIWFSCLTQISEGAKFEQFAKFQKRRKIKEIKGLEEQQGQKERKNKGRKRRRNKRRGEETIGAKHFWINCATKTLETEWHRCLFSFWTNWTKLQVEKWPQTTLDGKLSLMLLGCTFSFLIPDG